MSTDLNFKTAYTPPPGGNVPLDFSASQEIPRVTGELRLTQSTPTLRITGEAHPATPVTGTLTLTVPTVQTLHVAAAYDNRVFRGPSNAKGTGWQEAAPNHVAKTSPHDSAANRRNLAGERWTDAMPLAPVLNAGFDQSSRLRQSGSMRWQTAAPQSIKFDSPFRNTDRVRTAAGAPWQAATRQSRSAMSRWQYPPHIKISKDAKWQESERVDISRDHRFGQGRKTAVGNGIPWQRAQQPSFGSEVIVVPPTEPPFEGDPDLNLICPWLDYAGDDIRLNFRVHPCPPVVEPPGDTIIVPVKRVYIVINTVSLRRVDGNVLLPTFSLSLSIDADSWTWGFNASLPAETLDAIEPGSDGTPVELEAMINGTAYRVLAEKIGRDRSFGRAAIRVSGKGKSGLLDSPYAPIQNFSNSSAARTAQQLMNDALTVNGASIGWTVNWQATDWLVPAGAWSHQGSYISALNAIAGAAGAYIQPHPNLKTLNVLSRYPTAPWNWGSLAPDFELPADVTTRESIEWLERPRYNRVFVSGQGQGVLGQVTRGGTAGDIVAPMVTDALITHADAARQRGLAVLGDTGRQAHLSLRLPVLAETGVIQPGKFVRYVDGGVTRLGIVRSTSVDVSNPEVWQTIGVETHVATA